MCSKLNTLDITETKEQVICAKADAKEQYEETAQKNCREKKETPRTNSRRVSSNRKLPQRGTDKNDPVQGTIKV